MKLLPSRRPFGYGHLKQMETEGDVAGLVAALEVPRVRRSKNRRAAVVTSLRRTGDPAAVPVLCELLGRDPAEAVRRGAAFSLGGFADAAALPALRAALDDKSATVRLWSVCSLGQLRDRESVERLTVMLDDPNRAVQTAATATLKSFGLT